MAIIGPRPLLVRYLDRYNEEQRHRHDVRPGLTSHEERLSTSLITPILLPSGECLAVVVYIR